VNVDIGAIFLEPHFKFMDLAMQCAVSSCWVVFVYFRNWSIFSLLLLCIGHICSKN